MATETAQSLSPADDPQLVGEIVYIADLPFLRVGRLYELLDTLAEQPEHAATIAAVKAEVESEVI